MFGKHIACACLNSAMIILKLYIHGSEENADETPPQKRVARDLSSTENEQNEERNGPFIPPSSVVIPNSHSTALLSTPSFGDPTPAHHARQPREREPAPKEGRRGAAGKMKGLVSFDEFAIWEGEQTGGGDF